MGVVASQLIAKVSTEGVDTAKSQLQSMGQAASETSGGFKSMLGHALSFAAGQAIFNAGAQAIGFLKDQLVGAVKESMDAQALMAQTEEVIKSTGGAAGMSAEQIADMAGELSHVTTFSDDAVQSGENLLLTFTGIGKDVFPQATKTMLDMSQAMGQDVKSSAIQLGKALNDPSQGLTALTRIGVTFTDQQKEQIQTMQAAGDVAGAQKVILGELQREFGGSAEAAGKTFGGQLIILKQRLDDVKQQIGDALMPVLTSLVGWTSNSVIPVLERFGGWFSGSAIPAIQQFGSSLLSVAGPALSLTTIISPLHLLFTQFGAIIAQVLPPALGIARQVFDGLRSVLVSVAPVVQGQLVPAVQHLATTIIPIVAHTEQWLEKSGLIRTVLAALSAVLPPLIAGISAVITVLASIISFFTQTEVGIAILKAALILLGTAFTILAVVAVGAFIAAIPGMIAGFIAGAAGAWAMAAGVIALTWPILAAIAVIAVIVVAIQHWGDIMNFIRGVVGNVMNAIGGFFGNVGGIIHNITGGISNAFSAMGSKISGVWNGVVGAVKGAINSIISGINSFIGAINSIQIHIPAVGVGPVHTPAFDWGGLGIPMIPSLAQGGFIDMAGYAMVGDAPETVWLPRGAQVIPNSQLGGALSGSDSKQPVTIVVNLGTQNVARILLPDLVNEVRHATGNWSF